MTVVQEESPSTTPITVKIRYRYQYGFKYCTKCGIWVRPEEVDYRPLPSNPNLQVPRCPECGRTLRSRPKYEAAKKRITETTGGVWKRH
jgi:NAD-dependent SIR2 family protein deacetylase